MSARRPLVVRVERRTLAIALVVALAGAALKLSSESLTMTASYPAPVGVYNQIVTTGNSGRAPADTTLNRNAGNTILVPPSNAGGRVGVGTTSPGALLDVNGIGNLAKLSLAGLVVGDLPAGTKSLGWVKLDIPGVAPSQTAISYSGCSAWYTSGDTCDGGVNGGYTCNGTETRQCRDLVDNGCAWGVRSVYVWQCTAGVPAQTVWVLSASTSSAVLKP